VRPDLGDAGPLLDATAKAELEEAEGFNDPARATKARQEMEFLVGELARAVGLGGTAPTPPTPGPRSSGSVDPGGHRPASTPVGTGLIALWRLLPEPAGVIGGGVLVLADVAAWLLLRRPNRLLDRGDRASRRWSTLVAQFMIFSSGVGVWCSLPSASSRTPSDGRPPWPGNGPEAVTSAGWALQRPPRWLTAKVRRSAASLSVAWRVRSPSRCGSILAPAVRLRS
jgi:hypothetical protein